MLTPNSEIIWDAKSYRLECVCCVFILPKQAQLYSVSIHKAKSLKQSRIVAINHINASFFKSNIDSSMIFLKYQLIRLFSANEAERNKKGAKISICLFHSQNGWSLIHSSRGKYWRLLNGNAWINYLHHIGNYVTTFWSNEWSEKKIPPNGVGVRKRRLRILSFGGKSSLTIMWWH